MATCEKCWDDAYMRSRLNGRGQVENYRDLLEERKDNPCLEKERRPMTERNMEKEATDIWEKLPDFHGHDAEDGIWIIAAALEAAYERGRKDADRDASIARKIDREETFAEGYRAGVEEAAKIVQKWIDNNCVGKNPALVIRVLKPGGKS